MPTINRVYDRYIWLHLDSQKLKRQDFKIASRLKTYKYETLIIEPKFKKNRLFLTLDKYDL